MSSSLRALLSGIIDYAGLFPPASLSLEQALERYAVYRQGDDRWMLGRFIIPASRLTELAAYDALFYEKPPFLFSILGRGSADSDSLLTSLQADLTAIAEFRDRHPGRVEVDGLEVKLPDDVLQPENHHSATYTLVRAVELIESLGPPTLAPYYEIALTSEWPARLTTALDLLHNVLAFAQQRAHGRLERCRPPGFKLRCGGLEPAAMPTTEQVAAVIAGCREHGLPWKATAGLHHPLRTATAHGFVNVFGAGVLAAAHGLDEGLLGMILADEEAGHFAFGDEGFSWGKVWVDVEKVASARAYFATSFGSCSFDEPREDLRALGWL